MLIDSHVNLHAAQFDEDRDAVIERARAAGVGLMVEISDALSTFEATHSLAMAHADIWCTVGAHPHEARHHLDMTADDLVGLAQRPRVVGIGECGLDFHYDLSPRDQQETVFRVHIEAARRTGLPLVVHTREADDRMVAILREGQEEGPFKFLMHCYTSGAELAVETAEMDAWFSVSGIATFKAAEDVRAIIRTMPEDRIIVETDCPYLAPVPHRGRRNEPAYVSHVLEALADIRGWTADEAKTRTTDAFFNLFDRIPEAVGMSGQLEITILGCGSSGGVPRGDGDWGVCNPAEPKNLRTRCSMLARRRGGEGETSVLIDTSPDLRQQMLAARATRVDGVLITHDHADQTHGIDDLRVFALRRRQRIPAWMDPPTRSALTGRFDYIFKTKQGYPAILDAKDIPDHGVGWQIDGPGGPVPVMTFDQGHGPIRSIGYRLGSVSYSSDVDVLSEDALKDVSGSKLWIVDALRWTRHPTHAHVDQALEWIAAADVGKAVLTNLHIDLDYNVLKALVPENVEIAHDGWTQTVSL